MSYDLLFLIYMSPLILTAIYSLIAVALVVSEDYVEWKVRK